MTKKLIIIRYAAYGDFIHASMLPRLFSEQGYEVTFEYSYKGLQLLAHNPYIKNHIAYEPTAIAGMTMKKIEDRINAYKDDYDRVVNMNLSLERGTLALEDMKEYDWSAEKRREKYDNNYYDWTLKWAGLEEHCGKGIRGEVYYSSLEEEIVKNYFEKYKYRFCLFVNLAGTGLHKTYPHMAKVIEKFTRQYPEAHVFTTGDKECALLEWEGGPRVHHLSGKFPFRQVLLMMKYANGVIGCESGIMVGATMWDVPTCQLMTAASINCHVPTGVKNDFSLQSKAPCSPCFRGPYLYDTCNFDMDYQLPVCVMSFDKDEVFKKLVAMHLRWTSKGNPALEIRQNDFPEVKYEIRRLKCPLCYVKNEEVVRKSNEHVYYKCEECGIFYTHKENLNPNKYDNAYVQKYDKARGLFINHADYFFPLIRKYKDDGRLLEVGPMNTVIKDRAIGFDSYQLDIPGANKKKSDVLYGNFETYNFGETKFSVIWMTHVFEHFLKPIDAIAKIASLLEDRGVCLLSMPDPDQINWKNPLLWNHWHGDEHYIMWTIDGLEKHLEDNNLYIKEKHINVEGFPVTGGYDLIIQKNMTFM